jgi:hypothetical protein
MLPRPARCCRGGNCSTPRHTHNRCFRQGPSKAPRTYQNQPAANQSSRPASTRNMRKLRRMRPFPSLGANCCAWARRAVCAYYIGATCTQKRKGHNAKPREICTQAGIWTSVGLRRTCQGAYNSAFREMLPGDRSCELFLVEAVDIQDNPT